MMRKKKREMTRMRLSRKRDGIERMKIINSVLMKTRMRRRKKMMRIRIYILQYPLSHKVLIRKSSKNCTRH